jgi:transcription termination factor Rho
VAPKKRATRKRATVEAPVEEPVQATPAVATEPAEGLAPELEAQVEAPKKKRGRPKGSTKAKAVSEDLVAAQAAALEEAALSAIAGMAQAGAAGVKVARESTQAAERAGQEALALLDGAAQAVASVAAEALEGEGESGDARPARIKGAAKPGRGAARRIHTAQDAPEGERERLGRERAEAPTAEAAGSARVAGTSRQERQERGERQERQERDRGQGQYQQKQRWQERQQKRPQQKRPQKAPIEPSVTREELAELKLAELKERALELEVETTGLKKQELVEAVYEAAARAEGFTNVSGVLDIVGDGYGFLRAANFMQGDGDAFVPQSLIKSLGLRRGDLVTGTARPARPNDKYPALGKVETVNGHEPRDLKARVRFRDLTPIYPNERLRMEHGADSLTGRAIDLVAPIGKGQRGLIVSPPKAGKTTILKRVCQSIALNNPEVYLMCLLVDERPEEVTDMRRSIKGEVVASTFDMPAENHTSVAELVIERAKRMVEEGHDVVVVLDSITRLARAYNLAAPASGRILSGGVDSAALYPPKRFLGAARNIENGGSLTILASALIDTGSKMDEVIFEEFKGTGNMELKLDRDLADKRIFPAIDPVASGTRNEDLLIDPEMAPFVWGLRRILANMNNVERAEKALVNGLKGTKDNKEFLIRSAKKAAMSEYSELEGRA